ncbi:MAG: alpha-amylase family glycosyl hydrolase [Bacteroidota bacterium]
MIHKHIIYQLFVRIFGNKQSSGIPFGSMEENGVGKFNDISLKALEVLKKQGITHIWYTGVLEQACLTEFTQEGIPPNSPEIVKGRAGSPYAIKDYYDVSPELATEVSRRMEEFEALVNRTKEQGLKVLIDFVPNHVAREYNSDVKPEGIQDFGVHDNLERTFTPQNNFYYIPGEVFVAPYEHKPYGGEMPYQNRFYVEIPAKASGNDVFSAIPSYYDWFETIKLNYGVDYTGGGTAYFDPIPDTWSKMYDILHYWAQKGIDGFRCDMVHMVPLAFWKWVIAKLKQDFPHLIFIGEIYDPTLYEAYIRTGGFDYLYDKVGVYDMAVRMLKQEDTALHIRHALAQSEHVADHMLRFMENHDEQRIASPHLLGDPKAGVPAMTFSACLGRGPVLIYFGQEVGECAIGASGFSGDDGRTTIFDYWHAPIHQLWMNNGAFDGSKLSDEQKELLSFYRRLSTLCQTRKALREGHFYELPPMPSDNELIQHKIYGFLRYLEEEYLLILINFDRHNSLEVPIYLPEHAWQCMGLDAFQPYSLTDILSTDTSFELTGDSIVTMEPWSAYIFELNSTKKS